MTDPGDATTSIGRRRYLIAGTSGLLAASAGCLGGGGGNDDNDGEDGEDGTPDRDTVSLEAGVEDRVDSWLENADNYDGSVLDYTDATTPVVKVGTQGNGGNLAYTPVAIAISTGTTVRWEWTGKGRRHNVVDDDGAYESELVATEGHTFEHTFDSEGASLYFCTPHKGLGMKGAVVVRG